jgi:16S rRNA (adenine1518-N6/adenine1519-N6)-dimethyltransferase
LTAPLLRRLDHLHVVEIDRDIVARLRQGFSPEKLTVHAGDALVFDFGRLARAAGGRPAHCRQSAVQHLDAAAFHLAGFAHLRARHAFHAAEGKSSSAWSREPGSGDVRRLSVMLQYRFVMERLLDVPPEAFNPAPKVHSAWCA